MAGDGKTNENNEVKNEPAVQAKFYGPATEEVEEKYPSYSSDSESESESEEEIPLVRPRESKNSRNAADNIRNFMNVINSKRIQRRMEKDVRASLLENEIFEFPKDPEKWKEEDLKELWADPPAGSSRTGWDPNLANRGDIRTLRQEIWAGREPLIGPFYIPYRKPYPVIPDNHYDISNPKGVIEELDRIEEFLRWVSYVFEDHSSYEGTVWDDKAHGKGVFVGEKGLVRYEGEWLNNDMEGHGVVEVEIPHMQPIPGSKLEKKMRAQGRIINRDFMTPEDREWLEMDIEDSIEFTDGRYQIPFYERKEWKLLFGKKPEKGQYKYAGQWKHGRMHGCGVYKVNEQTIYGRFYFGEFVERDTYGCDLEISAMHAGLAEVAAAKARMFTNKPDGMVREERGPYGDPQHPYFYEEEDVWMAPGFINQFYEVPDYWEMYVHEVDQERELWLNSFYKAPLRLPMPAELEYWWANDEEEPEFSLVNKEPEPDPEDPSKLIYTEDPFIMHIPTGRIIDYVDDEEHGIRLFWAPDVKEGDVGPDTEAGEEEDIDFLPLGFDEFYGRNTDVVEEEHFLKSLVLSVEKTFKPMLTKLEKWAEEQKKDVEMKMELIKKEHELTEAESALNEAVDELDSALKMLEEMEEKKAAEMGIHEEDEEEDDDGSQSKQPNKFEKKREEFYKEVDDEEEGGEGDSSSFSFGSVENQEKAQDDQKNGNREAGKSPFEASSLPFAACFLASQVPCKLQHSFMTWKEGKARQQPSSATALHFNGQRTPDSIAFPNSTAKSCRLRAARDAHYHGKLPRIVKSKHAIRFKKNASQEIQEEESSFSILSLHTPLVA